MTFMRWTSVLLVAAVAGLCGCVKYTKPLVAQEEMTPAQRNFEATWVATQEVLRDYRFTIDRLDKRAGVITTEPLTGMQVFEFWRKDAATREALLAGSIQTLQRTVTVRIRPTGGAGEQYEPLVQVSVTKPGAGEHVQSASDAYSMFILPGGEERQHPGRLPGYTPSQAGDQAAQSVGTDVALASRLREDIVAAAEDRLAGDQ